MLSNRLPLRLCAVLMGLALLACVSPAVVRLMGNDAEHGKDAQTKSGAKDSVEHLLKLKSDATRQAKRVIRRKVPTASRSRPTVLFPTKSLQKRCFEEENRIPTRRLILARRWRLLERKAPSAVMPVVRCPARPAE